MWTDGEASTGTRVSAILITETGWDDWWVTGETVAATAVSDNAGRYRIQNLQPGQYHIVPGVVYKVFAWEDLENFGYFDPDLLKRSETLGRPVHIDESSNVNVDVKLIPAAP